jgi:hypothetical protein
MIGLLALRHLLVRPGRAATLLIGYGLGVAVMIVLLSVGEAMLEQSRDVALVGGGDLVAIPEGLDLEGLRTGAVTGLFYGIDRARFVSRQMVAGPRHAATIIAASPVIEEKRLILRRHWVPGSRSWPGAGPIPMRIAPGSPRRRSSSTTNSTASICHAAATPPGESGTTSTSW